MNDKGHSKELGNIGLRFIDVMIGIILGLGFQWWPNLGEFWQYLAFIFVYFDITDYWIDYSPSLKRFPPKREFDLLIDMAIMFSIFLYIYATQLAIIYFLGAYILFNAFDIIWLARARYDYSPTGSDGAFLSAWITFNGVEIIYTLALIAGVWFFTMPALTTLLIFITLRILTRVLASIRYKRVYFL